MSNIFGFSTEPASNEDFLPRIQYDARSGQFTRIERVQGVEGFVNEPVIINHGDLKFLADFDNLETGWIDFTAGPSFHMVRLADLRAGKVAYPAAPSAGFKHGVSFTLKLAKAIPTDKPVRTIASTAKAFVGGVEAIYLVYDAERAKHPGMLPVLMLDGAPVIQKTGSGAKSSTAYRPRFRIAAWVPRGDLVHVPRQQAAPAQTNWSSPPVTGSRPAAPPPPAPETSASDFG
jgi:hypothetical protein